MQPFRPPDKSVTSKKTFSLLSKPLGHCSPADTQHEAAAATDQADANPEAHPEQQQSLAALSGGSVVTFLHAPDSQFPRLGCFGLVLVGGGSATCFVGAEGSPRAQQPLMPRSLPPWQGSTGSSTGCTERSGSRRRRGCC